MVSQMNKVHIETTGDGSHTLFHPGAGEHYHSIHGAIQESEHVFIEAGLKAVAHEKQTLDILEVGFGTGLNALLTMHAADKLSLQVRYTCFEPYPLGFEIYSQLNYVSLTQFETYQQPFLHMHSPGNGEVIRLLNNFEFIRFLTDIQNINAGNHLFDLVYFDAFSPAAAPELWTQEIFTLLRNCVNPGAILVTYSAKGSVRRALQAAGFVTERLPGPPGKREMLRGRAV